LHITTQLFDALWKEQGKSSYFMSSGTIIFVHGTGVRLKNYRSSFDNAAKLASACGITQTFVPCAWGDPLGIEFQGKSLPDPPSREELKEDEQDFAVWNWLLDDPLFELDKLTIRDRLATSNGKEGRAKAESEIPNPRQKPEWQTLWDEIEAYEPSRELELLLERGDLVQLWGKARSEIMEGSSVPKQAFMASAHELADAAHALARALVAEMHLLAIAEGRSAPNRVLRNSIIDRLTVDWHQQVLGLGTFLWERVARAATRVLRQHREAFSGGAALPVGDILLYQSRGQKIREFIASKIEPATPPVTIVAHSLGGIACFDLLVVTNLPKVELFVTAGSQSSLLYEMGALLSLKPPDCLPPTFPAWLNFFDRNDFLSYFAGRLFPPRNFELNRDPCFKRDEELKSGQPFPASHSAYFSNELLWQRVRRYLSS
jgi:hypothetical protein